MNLLKKECSKRRIVYLIEKKEKYKLIGLLLLFIGIFLTSFSIGRFYVPINQVIHILMPRSSQFSKDWTQQMEVVVMHVRLPRIIAAAFIGVALSTAGCVYQGMFKNPMVSPDILGASAGAGFGAALGIFLNLKGMSITVSAFFFGILAVGLAVFAGLRYRYNETLGLVLAGIMISSLFSAAISFIKLVADPTDQLPAITYWLMGSLASIRLEDLYLLCPCVIIGIVPLVLLRWRLNVMTQGDEEAKALGVNVYMLRIIVITCATLISAVCVATSGMIGWIGLVVPHLARKVIGCDYKYLLPTTMLMGGSFMLVVDNIARTVSSSEIPIGILTAFVGTPFFLYMIFKGGNS